ncbi:acetyl-CoA carboxylase biotin carboxyl carrier protein [Algihabitans albus]|uniref:acetyl-CoA carboxylase biotin carboxyl carrier protein n=1 Tax=Algihabitans albus TaxID=2164067 RepID=UPI000E5CAF94|nr:acetyl-CoA carboxylase biotin carboxyl carrier protein [Algihabitans albus]
MSKFPIDEEAIRKLAELLSETGLSEIEIEDDDRRLRVARQAAPLQTAVVPAGPPVAVKPVADEPAAGPHPGTVASPMVGTVYLAPEPGAGPFVQVGDQVREGQTLLIIEAMKVMNNMPSPRAGKVTAILVEDGTPVEFGEPLVVVE